MRGRCWVVDRSLRVYRLSRGKLFLDSTVSWSIRGRRMREKEASVWFQQEDTNKLNLFWMMFFVAKVSRADPCIQRGSQLHRRNRLHIILYDVQLVIESIESWIQVLLPPSLRTTNLLLQSVVKLVGFSFEKQPIEEVSLTKSIGAVPNKFHLRLSFRT